jgi:hypothetical protein
MATGVIRVMVTALVALWGSAGSAQAAPSAPGRVAQQRPAQRPGDQQISVADIQAMFDAMAVLDAEKFVVLTSEQYPVFVQKLKRVQDARRQLNQRRNRAMNELRVLVNSNPASGKVADDAAIDVKLKELDAIETEGHSAVEKALDDVDQLLSPRQRARFRILEDNTERKKLDFLTRVRGGRGGQ